MVLRTTLISNFFITSFDHYFVQSLSLLPLVNVEFLSYRLRVSFFSSFSTGFVLFLSGSVLALTLPAGWAVWCELIMAKTRLTKSGWCAFRLKWNSDRH